jgi:predicted DsbA family dithiol-disulfide isomerase
MRIEIDLFVDIVCPWCFVGTHRLERVLDEQKSELEPEIRFHPFLLNPNVPPEGFDVIEKLRRKYGTDPRQLFVAAEAAARESGLELDLMKQPRTYSTAAAHTLLRHAHQKKTHRALALALYQAHFHDAKNISDANVLADLGAAHGFSREETLDLICDVSEVEVTKKIAAQAISRAVTGVPHYVFDGRVVVHGAEREEILRRAITRALEPIVDN